MKDYDIAILKHRKATRVQNQVVSWEWVVEKCSVTHRTSETFIEYQKAPKSRQAEIKDIGGFVGGLTTGNRKKNSIVHRTFITLDADFATPEFWILFQKLFGNTAALAYTTHSHSPEQPRYRLVIPLDRPATPLEYEPLARKVADILGIDQFDHTGYDVNRLMYWPSSSKDGIFDFFKQDGEPLQVDTILSQYSDWKDISQWAIGSAESKAIQLGAKKQGDPTEKEGLIGAFCRVYDVETTIEEFLSDVYVKCDTDGRYTYQGGTTAAGLVIYDGGRFAYSHHSTDPISGKLCNAFDLVRLHKFGDLDENASPETPTNRLPGYQAMLNWIGKNKEVVQLLAREKLEEAGRDFTSLVDSDQDEITLDWTKNLDVDRKGNLQTTVKNYRLIIQNDHHLKGKFVKNIFSHRIEVRGGLPWNPTSKHRQFIDSDENSLKEYIEDVYGLNPSHNSFKIGVANAFNSYSVHPVKEYLQSLQWDGIKRLDTLLIDFLGAEDNELVRAYTRKAFTAAVARIEEPGIKFDYILTLQGPQGIGKSTLVDIMGGEWYSDSFGDLTRGNEAEESIQGVWLMEIGELAGMKKASVEKIKHFISKREDSYRIIFEKWISQFPRQCIFLATTNEREFLMDTTGNRRFWVVEVKGADRNLFEELKPLRNQIWAEAVTLYLSGEELFLSKELEESSRELQAEFTFRDTRFEMIPDFLEMPLPEKWKDMKSWERRDYFLDPVNYQEQELNGTLKVSVPRTRVAPVEIWVEVFGNTQESFNAFNSKPVRTYLRSLPDWEENKSNSRIPVYGSQRCFIRK